MQELIDNGSDLFDPSYLELSEKEQIKILSKIKGDIKPDDFKEEMIVKTLGSIRAVQEIQSRNGEKGPTDTLSATIKML